jgi:hypothetical protein
LQIGLRAGLVCATVAAVILLAGAHFGTGVSHEFAAGRVDPALAQASWSSYVRSHWTGSGAIWWLAKAPTWIGLALLTIGCANAVAKKDLVFGVPIEHAPIVS